MLNKKERKVLNKLERTVREWTNEEIESTSLEHAYNDRFDALTMVYRVKTSSGKVFHNFQYMDYDTYDEKYRYKFGKDNDRYLKLFCYLVKKEGEYDMSDKEGIEHSLVW